MKFLLLFIISVFVMNCQFKEKVRAPSSLGTDVKVDKTLCTQSMKSKTSGQTAKSFVAWKPTLVMNKLRGRLPSGSQEIKIPGGERCGKVSRNCSVCREKKKVSKVLFEDDRILLSYKFSG